MASFLDALNAGSRMAEVGIASYDRAKEWSAKLQAAAEAHEEKAAEFKTKAAQVDREDTETARHNKAVEGEWKPGSRGGSRGVSGMDHGQVNDLNYLKELGVMATKDSATPEDVQAYHDAAIEYADKYKKKKPTVPSASAPVKDEGFSWGKASSAISGAVKEGADFFHKAGAPAPAPQTMTGTMNGKRVKLTKTAAGWTDESGQVVK